MLSVAILVNSMTGGGAERSMNLLSEELTKLGFKVTLIAVNSGPEDLAKPSCEVIELNRPWRGNLISTISARFDLQRTIDHVRPDVIIANCELPELLVSTLKYSGRLIVVEHTSLPWRGRRLLGLVIRTILSFRCKTWVRVSEQITLWPNNLKTIYSIPNPLTPISLHQFGAKAPTSCDRRLVYIGRLSPEKRPEWALKISTLTGLPVIFIGNGELISELQSQSLDVQAISEFVGFQRLPWSFVGPNDLVIVPSKVEGDGLVVLEALSLDLQVLLANNSDLRKFGLPEKNYFESPESIAELLNTNMPLDFRVDTQLKEQVLHPRNIEAIGLEWKSLLQA